ncbi:MAG: hypothetical protein L6R35_006851 [Caloplaca aegaea]|nr:MAG: hypothetical protein L6R35_006851 [Caloplaca aegaea]
MGQASDFLFSPIPRSNNDDDHLLAHEESTTIRADSKPGRLPSLGGRDSPVAMPDSATSPEILLHGNPRVEEAPDESTSLGSSFFRGLSQLLQNLPVLRAVDTFYGIPTQTDEDNLIDSGNSSSDGPLSVGDQIPNAQPSPNVSGARLEVNDKITKQESMNLHQPPNRNMTGMLELQPESVHTLADPEKVHCYNNGAAEPLFQSFGRPSSMQEDIEDVQSINYDDLFNPNDDDIPSNEYNSEDRTIYFSCDESEDDLPESQIKPGRTTRSKSMRKVVKGDYHRKKSPQAKRADRRSDWIIVDQLPVQTLAATRKPTVVPSLIRQVSHQPTISDGLKSGSGLLSSTVNAAGDTDYDALAPFNRLERQPSC